MNCTNCGTKIEEADVNFCPNCGANLSEQQVVSQTPVTATPAQAVIVTDPAQVLPKRDTQRTVIIACLVVIGLVVLAVAGIFLWKVLGSRELLLDADTIKDDALRNTLTVEYDKDGDGKLSEDELDQVQTLELDAGDSYDYLNLFINLYSVNVKNTGVSELDLSQNKNLKSANFKDATNLKTVKLPNIPSYNDVVLPDREDVDVEIPNNSEYEVKYVPSKVEETVQGPSSSYSVTTEQTVVNANKVSGLVVNRDGTTTNYEFVYGDDGLVKQTNSTYQGSTAKQKLTYSNNQLINENFQSSTSASPYRGDYSIEYGADSAPTQVDDYRIEHPGETLTVSWIDASNNVTDARYVWKTSGDKLSQYTGSVGNGNYFSKYNFDYANSNLCSKMEISMYPAKSALDNAERYSGEEKGPQTVSFEYENDELKTATFDNGVSLNYEYNSNGYLVKVTNNGDLGTVVGTVTTNCSIQYSPVIAKKTQTPLSFITLPRALNNGGVDLSVDTRQIAVSSSWAKLSFSGKFWWDEENILANQAEASNKGKSDSKTENVSTANIEVETHSSQVSVPCDPYYPRQDGQERQDATWEYDLLTNPNNSAAVDQINSKIQDSFDKSVQKAESIPYGKEVTEALLSREIKVSYMNEEIVCFVDAYSWTGWGPHGLTEQSAVTYNLKTGERVDIASYFGETQSELLSETKQAVSTYLTNNPSDINSTDKVVAGVTLEKNETDSLGIGFDGASKLAFKENGVLCYMTDNYELGSYAFGMRLIVVKSDNSSDIGKHLSDIKS